MTVTFLPSQPERVQPADVAVRLYSGGWMILHNVPDGELLKLVEFESPKYVQWEHPEDSGRYTRAGL